MATILGDPKRDPHGDPIPGLDGTLDEPVRICLADLSEGSRGRVLRVPDRDPPLLRYFADIRLVPETDVYVVRREPFDGPHTSAGPLTNNTSTCGFDNRVRPVQPLPEQRQAHCVRWKALSGALMVPISHHRVRHSIPSRSFQSSCTES